MHDGYLEIINQQKGSINTESQYPYTSVSIPQLTQPFSNTGSQGGGTSKGKCNAKAGGVATGFTGYANVTHGDEMALAAACAEHTVISVAIDASVSTFQFYSNGVYDGVSPRSLAHCLTASFTVTGHAITAAALLFM